MANRTNPFAVYPQYGNLLQADNRVKQPDSSKSFMDEYEYNRAHIADNPDAFANSMRTILAALT